MSAAFVRTARITHELRSIRAAWFLVLCALGLFAHVGAPLLGRYWLYLNARDADAVGMLIWLAGATLIAAQAFSLDYQERTVLLRLSQPISRGRAWLERFSAVLLAEVGLGAAFLLLFGVQYEFRPYEAGLSHADAAFLVLVMMSAAVFWAGVTRTLIGTFTFAGASGYAAFLLAVVLDDHASWGRIAAGLSLVLVMAAYWRSTRTEVIDGFVSPRASDGAQTARSGRFISLPVVRRSAVWNYLAKEIRFQRTSFVLVLVFGGLLAALDASLLLGLVRLGPEDSAAAFAVPHIFVLALVAIVCGSSSICEEQRLGTALLDRALPRRRLLFFAGRFLVSGAVFAFLVGTVNLLFVPSAILGFHAPTPPGQEFLESITGFSDRAGVGRLLLEPSFLLLSLFVVSFWVSTRSRNASEALLLALPCFLTCAGAAAWGLQSTYLEIPAPINRFAFEQLPVGRFVTEQVPGGAHSFTFWSDSAATGGAQAIFGMALAALALALGFSWVNFRAETPRPGLILVQLPFLICAAYFLGLANLVIDRAPQRLMQAERQAWLDAMSPIDDAVRQYLDRNSTGSLATRYTITSPELQQYLARAPETGIRAGQYEVIVEAAAPYNGGGRGAQYSVRINPPVPVPGNRYFLPAVGQWEIFLSRSGRPYARVDPVTVFPTRR